MKVQWQVNFSSSAGEFLKDCSWIPPEIDVIKLETVLTKTLLSKQAISVKSRTLRRLEIPHLGAGAYVLSKKAALQLLDRSKLIDIPVDDLIFDPISYGLNFTPWQLCAAICIQDCILNPNCTQMETQISKEYRGLKPREKPKSILEKISRELRRPFKQVTRTLREPKRLARRQRQPVTFE